MTDAALRSSFHRKLDEVRAEVVRMCAIVTEMIPRATDAFLNNDLDAAQQLIDDDDLLDAVSVNLDTMCTQLLALQQPMATDENEIVPIEAHGIKAISMGFLIAEDSAVIVRGPLATRYTQQFLRQCLWGELDYLILDLPPGTGDIQLTIVQTVSVDAAVLVTTPQEVALIDARKAASMFKKVNVPIAGVVENMAWFECNHGEKYFIFGEGGGETEAARLGVPLLARIPLDPETRKRADSGDPIANLDPGESSVSKAFAELAGKLAS